MPIELNDLECKRFDIRAARVVDPRAALSEINAAARAQRIDMLTLRIDTNEIARVQELEADGYRLMDTLVYYDRSLDDLPAPSEAPPEEHIRLATPADAIAVGHVAQAGFGGYFGHYHADPRLSNEAADAAYVEWAETSARHCGDRTPVLVAEVDRTIIGFLTIRAHPDNTGEIVLNAVHPSFKGQGIYGRLVDHGLKAMRSAGLGRAFTSTQVNNIAVQKVWGLKGMRMLRSVYTLHKWF